MLHLPLQLFDLIAHLLRLLEQMGHFNLIDVPLAKIVFSELELALGLASNFVVDVAL